MHRFVSLKHDYVYQDNKKSTRPFLFPPGRGFQGGWKSKTTNADVLGRVEDNRIEELAAAISKHLETINIFNLSKEIDISDTYILGPLLVFDRLYYCICEL